MVLRRLSLGRRAPSMLDQIADVDALFPSKEDAAFFGQTCATCHNAHDNTLHSQLRNPSFSTEFFSYVTSRTFPRSITRTSSSAASATTSAARSGRVRAGRRITRPNTTSSLARSPDPAPPMRSGINDEFPWAQPLQCVQCHTHGHEVEDPDEETPNYTGHTFEPELHGCTATGCHTSESVAQVLWTGAQTESKAAIQNVVKAQLDNWA
jgi:hypothetical protein